MCGSLPPRADFPIRNAEEWNSTNLNAPPVAMPLGACPPAAATESAPGPLAGPDGGPIPLPGLGQRGGPTRPGDSRARIERPRPAPAHVRFSLHGTWLPVVAVSRCWGLLDEAVGVLGPCNRIATY